MQKIFVILVAVSGLICGLMFSGCRGNTPSGAVEKTLNALIKQDFDTYLENCFFLPDKLEQEDVRNVMKENSNRIEKFEILDEKMEEKFGPYNEKMALVKVKIFKKDGNEHTLTVSLAKRGSWFILSPYYYKGWLEFEN